VNPPPPPEPAAAPEWRPKLDPGLIVRRFLGAEKGPLLKRHVSPLRLIAASFLVAILIGTLLLLLPASRRPDAPPLTFGQALFTAASATTVTGLTVRDTADTFSTLGRIIILVLIQFGGLGYMTAMSFLFIFRARMPLGPGMLLQEQLGLPTLQDILSFARRVLGVVLLFEGIGAVLLALAVNGGKDATGAAFWGVFHAVAAFNNAGFDLNGGFRSLIPFAAEPLVTGTVMLLAIAGGLGFFTLGELYDRLRGRRNLSVHTRIVLWSSAALLIGGVVILFLLERQNALTLGRFGTAGALMNALFHSAVARTAGFSTVPVSAMGLAATVLLMIFMFIGASPTGTGGGVKTTTFTLALSAAIAGIRGREDVEAMGRRFSHRLVFRAFAILFIAAGSILAGTLLMAAFDNYPLYALLFEATSAFATTGLSTGITPDLSMPSQAVLMLLMYLGRLGPLSLIAAFLPSRKAPAIRLPEDQVSL
jgi:trk system potassium uptake protein TrkH